MSQRLFKVNGGYLVAQDLLTVVQHLLLQSGRPPRPMGLYSQQELHIEDLGEVKQLASDY